MGLGGQGAGRWGDRAVARIGDLFSVHRSSVQAAWPTQCRVMPSLGGPRSPLVSL